MTPRQLTFRQVLEAIQAQRETVGRRIVVAMVEEGLFRQLDNGDVVFVAGRATPRQMTRLILDCFVEALALAYQEEPPRLWTRDV